MKNKLLLLVFLVLCTTSVKIYGQAADTSQVVLDPEKKAEFSGGVNAWIKFLEKNLDRDLMYKKSAPRGAYKVLGSFLVDTIGQVVDIKIELDPGYGAADEFIRVLKLSSKKWIPAYDKGKAVLFRHRQSLTL
ncbi:MAG: ferric siderophore transport system, periplasmic binding protein TonB, partial [Sediminibacterium sp.]|nr:ferric siderophore transport system, periplasmic binding protein TonB [Sediminibacterium sp.]